MGRSTPVTLRRTWYTASLQLIAVIVGLGAVAVGVTTFTKAQFHSTTEHAQEQMTALTSLKSALVDVSITATPVMYGFEGSGSTSGNFMRYQLAAAKVDKGLAATEQVFDEPHVAAITEELRTDWERVDVAVRAAPEMLASGALEATLATGADPFGESVWDPYNRMDLMLLELHRFAVNELGSSMAESDRVHSGLVALVAAGVVLALALSGLAARRISRRVIAPLAQLRDAAASLHQSSSRRPVAIDGAALELHELAAAIAESTAALDDTHRLLRSQAGSDALTELPNRRAFHELLETKLSADDDRQVAVLFIDLDDFKIVNDSMGHAAGDELLRVVSRRLRSIVRADETVARLGGDEFAIVLRSDVALGAAIEAAERALAALESPVTIEGSSVTIGCSIGVAVGAIGSGPGEADDLLRNADFAMYLAKSQGKNRIEVFAPAMHAEMVAQMALKSDLGHAAALGQLELDYQPIVDVDSRALLGFEALIRWRHPERGLLSPDAFVSLAEDTGDIVAIGEWVLEEACAALAEHQRHQAPDDRPLWMSINVSPVEIARPGFVEHIVAALTRHGVRPESLMIEITEGVAITDTGAAAAVLDDLREHGVHVALDDFGTGFSSLRSLQDLPIDVIKIDRSFLVNASRGSDAESLLEMIVSLGRTLGLHIIAEGIETDEDLERLARFQIAGQGYLFARPLSPAAATAFRERAVRVAAQV